MTKYYVEKTPNDLGQHLIHNEKCDDIENIDDLKFIGNYAKSDLAVITAFQYYKESKECELCSDRAIVKL